MAINQTSLAVILTSLSFYFILYGVVETLFAYSKNRNPNTLFIASGLGGPRRRMVDVAHGGRRTFVKYRAVIDERSWTSNSIHTRSQVHVRKEE